MRHLTMAELNQGLDEIRKSPADGGLLELIVRRPAENEREELDLAELVAGAGIKGDNWQHKPSSSMPDGRANPEKEITIMNSRAIALIAQTPENRKWAGDQLYTDMNLGYDNLPPGTRLKVGDALLEVTIPPHRGCKKFAARYGQDALVFVNSEAGRELNLRGIHAKIITGGTIRRRDTISKVAAQQTA